MELTRFSHFFPFNLLYPLSHFLLNSIIIQLSFRQKMKSRSQGQTKNSADNFVCRLCRKVHALKSCWRFRNMNTTERREVVKKYGYCINCLAHSHSQGSCFTRTGCGYCHRQHHSLLHTQSRLYQSTAITSRSRSEQPKPSITQSTRNESTSDTHGSSNNLTTLKSNATSSTTSLTAILKQNVATLLPTALVKIDSKDGKRYGRCLLDSGSRMSCISKGFVDQLGLTSLELDGETICPVILWSCVDSKHKIEATLRVNNRITTKTPKESLPDSIKDNFKNFVLADKNFNKTSSIDIILGVDIYSKIIMDGIFVRAGLPTAQNTLFGIILYGTLST